MGITILFGVILILFGAFLFFGGINTAKKSKRQRDTFTSYVEATVIAVREMHSPGTVDSRPMRTYYPTIQFFYGGQNVVLEYKPETLTRRYVQGQKVILHMNPYNPNEFFIEGDKAASNDFILIAMGALFLIIGIFVVQIRM